MIYTGYLKNFGHAELSADRIREIEKESRRNFSKIRNNYWDIN